MKVFIVRSAGKEPNTDAGWYFHSELEGQSVEHVMFDHRAVAHHGRLAKELVNRTIRNLTHNRYYAWLDLYRQADSALLTRIEQFHPDILLVMSGKTISRDLLKHIRSIWPGLRTVNVFWDNPFFYDTAFNALPEYDYFFVKDTYVIGEMRKLGATNVHYLPQACHPPEHCPLDDLTTAEREKYGSDLSFVGSMYPYRVRILDVFADMDFKIWGSGSHGIISPDSVAFTKHQNEPVFGRAKVVVFNASKINLNTQNYQNDIFGASSKVYQIAASGGFQLIDYKRDLDRLFDVGRELILFRTRNELRELAEYYLVHPKEREEIAERSRRRALAEHTYAHRWQTILEAMDYE